MTRVKLCGLSTKEDILAVNALKPDYIGFVFAPNSRRYVAPEQAAELKQMLSPEIQAVGVFVNEQPQTVAQMLSDGVIDLAQLHGSENQEYLLRLRGLTKTPVMQAFRIRCEEDVLKAAGSSADYLLLDAGAGTGTVFDWSLLRDFRRPFFLAGGLDPENVVQALRQLHPFGVDVSSGIETDGRKDVNKMAAFVSAVRKEEPS